MENEQASVEEKLVNEAPVRSRSALFEFITRPNEEGSVAEERFQSSFNPYRKSENPFFALVKGPRNPKRPAELAD